MLTAWLILALFVLACWWAGVRDRYDQWRWTVEPDYPRYGASHIEVARWWWRERRVMALPPAMVLIGVLILSLAQASARDLDGRYAASPLKSWFDSLKSGKGPCCSDADGYAVSDPDWESKGGRYRVRIEGEWHDVPEDALITEPNRAGRTMVWPMKYLDGSIHIRCFMPGAMT